VEGGKKNAFPKIPRGPGKSGKALPRMSKQRKPGYNGRLGSKQTK